MSALERRAFLATLGLGLSAWTPAARAQAPVRATRIGWLSGGVAAQPHAPPLRAFREGLQERGFVIGQNAILDVRGPRRGAAREYRDLAAQIVAHGPDVILAANPSAIEAITAATSSIPTVGVDLESDPVAKGWVASLAKPGRSLTGFFLDIPEMSGKHLQLLQEVRPTLTQVSVLGDQRINDLQFKATEVVARGAGITLQTVALAEPGEIRPAIARAALQNSGALLVLTSPLINISLKRIADAALEHRLPAICGFVPSFAEVGGLLAYGPDFPDLFRRAAGYVAGILKGASARDLPVQRPTKFPLVVNMKTARILGLTMPPALQARADHVIE